ncbi:hypothetical protein JGH11_11015 [Dysgonomonas sp. Marseille-P4677]|uniref:hypothetical protein n=1 Tax=Dysgonomonas sp. Marseille-P4677 TaxID=2364790 RepID=UPI001913AE1B|nr:hypothetical protein [Dysgonomonas sp. Marseille-P4677]MBK5721404.1 hypothetical protein [Dysgonomonas sp. Marseille-P4677]
MITTYDQAKRLKELGYDRPTFKYLTEIFDYHFHNDKRIAKNHNEYEGVYSTPCISEALQWIREKYNVECGAYPHVIGNEIKYLWLFFASKERNLTSSFVAVIPTTAGCYAHCSFDTEGTYNTYPEAESALLDGLLKYLEEKDKK